jgi:Protein of unknown function (DUF1116)
MSQPDVLREVAAVNLGLPSFAAALRDQGARVAEVDWQPPAGGDPAAIEDLTRLWGAHGERVAAANAEAVARIGRAAPRAVDVARAGDAIDGLGDGVLLHSGPPIAWERVCDPQRRALVAAVLFEGWAPDRAAAERLLADGEVALRPGNEHGHVGPMTGVCSPSMAVWVVTDEASGSVAYSTLNEGPGDTLWFGVGGEEAIERLRFLRDRLGPTLARLIEREGPIDVFGLVAQGLSMGDELHMRSQATGNLLLRDLAGGLAAAGAEQEARFLAGNHHFFLTLTMAASKCASLAAAGTEASSVVTVMSRNGTDMGVQLAGLPGEWFVAPAARVQDALLRDGYGPDDAARDIGDSAIIECVGIGGMALAAAPIVAAFFGGDAAAALASTERMGEICVGESERFRLVNRGGAGTPVGIDARLVAELGITPQITTGVLHGSSGVGQIGAGVAHQPVEPFRAAVAALAQRLGDGGERGGDGG